MAVTDYLRGDGSQANPYIIHNAAAWAQFFCTDLPKGYFFEVVADIDCGGVSLVKSADNFSGTLNGNGHKVFNFSSKSGFWFSSKSYEVNCQVNDLWVQASCNSGSAVFWHQPGYRITRTKNCRFDITTNSSTYMFWQLAGSTYIENSIFNLYGQAPTFSSSPGSAPATMYAIMDDAAKINATGCVALSRSLAINPTKYPTLDYAKWLLDGFNIPSLIPQGRSDLTKAYAVKGQTKVGGFAAKRSYIAMSAAYLSVIKSGKTQANGEYLINLNDYYDPLLVCHYDDYGYPFQPSVSKSLGDRVHPPVPNGYVYECTTAGVTATSAPISWPTTGTLTSGSAIFTAKPIYKPETMLVVPQLIDLLTGLPV